MSTSLTLGAGVAGVGVIFRTGSQFLSSPRRTPRPYAAGDRRAILLSGIRISGNPGGTLVRSGRGVGGVIGAWHAHAAFFPHLALAAWLAISLRLAGLSTSARRRPPMRPPVRPTLRR